MSRFRPPNLYTTALTLIAAAMPLAFPAVHAVYLTLVILTALVMAAWTFVWDFWPDATARFLHRARTSAKGALRAAGMVGLPVLALYAVAIIIGQHLERGKALSTMIEQGVGVLAAPILRTDPAECETLLLNRTIRLGPEVREVLRQGQNHVGLQYQDGTLHLSAAIFADEGDLLVEIHDNEWSATLAPVTRELNADRRGLEVLNRQGRVILQLDLTGRCALTLQAELWDQGTGSIFRAGARGGFGIDMITAGQIPPTPIERLFQYPSALHRGERVSSD